MLKYFGFKNPTFETVLGSSAQNLSILSFLYFVVSESIENRTDKKYLTFELRFIRLKVK
jgi:hypothetical protein